MMHIGITYRALETILAWALILISVDPASAQGFLQVPS